MKSEIEAMVRDDYEQRWIEIQSRLSPAAGAGKVREEHSESEEEVIEEEEQVRASGPAAHVEYEEGQGYGESAGSSGNFASLFEGQHLTAEEQALLRELKQREKEIAPAIIGDNHIIASPTDFIDMDDEDDEYEEDEDDDDDHHDILQNPKMCDAEI